MDFRNIPSIYHPAYVWQWNSKVTKEGIKKQIDEMYDCGIRAFYVLGEPSNFRPEMRRTHLSPEYLSDEYLDLVYYSYKLAKEKGMHTWLYNEGGFPSGMACGKIREKYPHLAMKKLTLKASNSNEAEYFVEDENDSLTRIRADIAKRETTDEFIRLTHGNYKKVFGDALGSDVTLMFDDEAYMGSWSDGFDKIFEEKYGYSILPYLAFAAGDKIPEKEDEYRALSDYTMLCGDLVQKNYFIPMKEWLNENKMLGTGHLDLDNQTEGCRIRRYGNVMAILRTFDAPGIDVIWSQIDYPYDGSPCCDGMEFWPRFASAAARQQGRSLCTSESFAVFGSHMTPELMRYIINFQIIRGISRFNFMIVSYDRETVLCSQYRPNFIKENPGTDMLYEINDYAARLAYILENGKAELDTALYYPSRSICAGGKKGSDAARAFEDMGHSLESAGVAFDIIDEEFVEKAEWKNGALCTDFVSYKNIFVPEASFERSDITEKLSCRSAETVPCAERKRTETQIRKIILDNGDIVYLVCNTSGEKVSEKVSFKEKGNVYGIDLYSGEMIFEEHEIKEGKITVFPKLLKGELKVYYISKEVFPAREEKKLEKISTITSVSARKVREYSFDDKGIVNTFYKEGIEIDATKPWDEDFSGEVLYTMTLPELFGHKDVVLDMGEVRFFARVAVNGKTVAEKTIPPYRVKLSDVKTGDVLTILVANTSSNVCGNTDYFDKLDIKDVGPYNKKMVQFEKKFTVSGGLLGPIKIYREI